MSAPPFAIVVQPPLPPGWTEHLAPGGQPYYYNTHTQQSTYTRPLPPLPVYPVSATPPVAITKEKPLTKTPIPGTDWLRVRTTAGNTFFFHKVRKESVWTVPPEIREAVEALERSERQQEQQTLKNTAAATSRKEEEDLQEIRRVRVEVEESVKRKAEDDVPLDEIVISKRSRSEPEDEGAESAGQEGLEDEEMEEEEEWEREAAAQLAAQAEDERERQEEGKRTQVEMELQKDKELNMPERVNLSLDEGKALFKTLLREKEINPLHPWDISLPLFVSDSRYVLLPSISARREAFDEYCRDRARELRQEAVRKEASSPKEEFDRLLKEEVTSTRTSWTDFRRQWKKERRFWGWGRDDKEREKRFKEYIKELGDKKREAAQKAEKDFLTLLKESGAAKPDSSWKDVKRKINRDPRYDAVGSSSLREELFEAFLKAGALTLPSHIQPNPASQTEVRPADVSHAEKERNTQERKERAIREREEKVKADFRRLETNIDRSRMSLNRGESDQLFRTMLTDAIRDPLITWEKARQQLRNDPRFTGSPLPLSQQLHLFHTHIGKIRSKHLGDLYALFQSHTPSLATSFHELPLPEMITSQASMRLDLDPLSFKQQFDIWQRDRNVEAKRQFMEMLAENSFIEFWGRLGKLGGEGVDGGVKADDLEEGEGEGGGGTVDMKALAKTVDVGEMERVLRNDSRYIAYDHVPKQREQWIREYLSQLAPPGLSVHINQQSTGF